MTDIDNPHPTPEDPHSTPPPIPHLPLFTDSLLTSVNAESSTPATNKRKRKQENPTKLCTLEESANTEPFVSKRKKKNLQENPPLSSNKEEDFDKEKEGKEKKKKRYSKQEEYAFQWLKENSKMLDRKKKIHSFDFDAYKKELQDPSFTQCYLLPLFYFLGSSTLILEKYGDFDSPKVRTTAGKELIEKMLRWTDERAIPTQAMESLMDKYDKLWWKIPIKDKNNVRFAFERSNLVQATLYAIEESRFMDKEGNPVQCLIPMVRYESIIETQKGKHE